ncbi:MAG: hypothetical protein ACYTG7_07320 [Planctomycetota bacterium]|jgi:hypothetical protein
MKTSPPVFLAAIALLLLCAGDLHADLPVLEEGVAIQDGTAPLSPGSFTIPTVADMNNDGKKDLIVGRFEEGHIHLYLNQGTNLNPLFDGGTLIESNGNPITTSYA